MAFYAGVWLIQQDVLNPKHDSLSWELPDTTAISGHMSDTSNVEELLINPEDMTLVPTQIQFGLAEWSADEGFSPDHAAFNEFYVRDEAFYVRGFTPTDFFTDSFYTPAPSWYVRSFSGTDFFTDSFYTPDPSWYVRSFTGTDFFTDSFYTPAPSWYTRSFTPRGWLWQFYLQETGYD